MESASERVSSLIFEPKEVSARTHRFFDEKSSSEKNGSRVISSGMASLDAILNPMPPGHMRVVVARPSHGKTSIMMHYARMEAAKWARQEQKTTLPPIVVSAEMALEEIMLREVSNIIPVDSSILERGTFSEWERTHEAIDYLEEARPYIFIGHSLESDARRPRLSVENVRYALNVLVDKYGLPPSLVIVDYAQRMKLDKASRDRRQEVSEVVESCKDMTLEFSTALILGSQAGRSVDEKRPPIPDMSDAKETANLEETADSVLGLFRPCKTYKDGERIPGSDMTCTQTLFYVSIIKQRQGISGVGRWVYFDPAISRLTDLEIERYELNNY